MQLKSIGVIGVGTMGAGIMQVTAQTGWEVIGIERDDAVEGARQRPSAVRGHGVTGKAGRGGGRRGARPRHDHHGLASVARTDLVMDAVYEDVEPKRALLAEIDKMIPLVILAGATSGPSGSSGRTSSTPCRR